MTELINKLQEVVVNNYEILTGNSIQGRELKDIDGAIDKIDMSFKRFINKYEELESGLSIDVIYFHSIVITITKDESVKVYIKDEEITDELLQLLVQIKLLVNRYSK